MFGNFSNLVEKVLKYVHEANRYEQGGHLLGARPARGHQGWKQELGMSPQKDTQQKPQADPRVESPAEPQSAPTEPNASVPSTGVVWVRISPNQVMHTVVLALLSAAVVLGAFFLLWQMRTFVGWFVISTTRCRSISVYRWAPGRAIWTWIASR